MARRDDGLYCNADQAAEVLGVGDAMIRKKMRSGVWDLGTVEERDSRHVYRIEKAKVLKMAGLTEWPSTRKTARMTQAAAEAARMIRDEFGIETGKKLMEILAATGTVTRLQRQAMDVAFGEE